MKSVAHLAAREMAVVAEQFPFEPAVFKRLRLTFPEAIKILQENGYPDVSGLAAQLSKCRCS